MFGAERTELTSMSLNKIEKALNQQEKIANDLQMLSYRLKAMESIFKKSLKMSDVDFEKLINYEVKQLIESAPPPVIQCTACGRNMAREIPNCQFCGAINELVSN